jgi:hypothetical protein
LIFVYDFPSKLSLFSAWQGGFLLDRLIVAYLWRSLHITNTQAQAKGKASSGMMKTRADEKAIIMSFVVFVRAYRS